MRTALVLLVLSAATPALAGDTILPDGGAGDDLWNLLDDLPPHKSTDLGVSAGFADVTYWREYQPPWLTFGARFVYGVHVGERLDKRFGAGLGVGVDGPWPEYFSGWIEPQATYDHVAHRLQYGFSVGPSVLAHVHVGLHGSEQAFGVSPMVSARIGYSQPWSRVEKRMFVVLEPKMRWIAGAPNWTIAASVGSSHGW